MAPPNTNPAVHTELPQASSGVDVDSAKVEFLQLEKQLSNLPLDSTSASSSSDDLEKATPQEAASSRFDLREYLQSSNDANQNAGIQHKARFSCVFPYTKTERLTCNIESVCYMGRSPSRGRWWTRHWAQVLHRDL